MYQAALQLYMRNRGSKQWVSKVLVVLAVMESGKCEMMRGKGVYEKGQWRVIWQKKMDIEDVMEREMKDGCLEMLQT